MDAYNDSPEVDYAYNGLAQIAYRQKDYQKADRYYSKALDKGLAASKLKDITLGEAQTLLALNRPTDAKPLFEQVAGTRAWRGEATALSVLSLGDIQAAFARTAEQKGQIQQAQSYYAAANAYYQRVFVAYQKYPAIQAKAYLGSGEAFEKLVKFPEAANTYSEMLKNPNLTSLPEATEAKQRLANLTQK
jgi:tetratricopeptide (TPR) repeat protein